jgi:TonB family protein
MRRHRFLLRLGPALAIAALSVLVHSAAGCSGSVRTINRDRELKAPPPSWALDPLEGKCENVEPPIQTRRVDAKYPAEVRRARIEGDVAVTYVVDKDGSVVDVNVRSSPSVILSELALDSVEQSCYIPAYCDDQKMPVSVALRTTIQFRVGP